MPTAGEPDRPGLDAPRLSRARHLLARRSRSVEKRSRLSGLFAAIHASKMAVFWLGTLPMMLAVGLGMQRLLGPFRARLPELAASVVLLLGVLSLAGHFKILPGATWLHRLTPAVPVADGAPAIGHGP